MKRQISMIHIKSGIQCRLVFERDHNIVQSTQTINRFAAEPICKIFSIEKIPFAIGNDCQILKLMHIFR